MKRTIIILASALAMLPLSGQAQQVLTLDDCRQMALDNSNALKTARQKVEIAGYDRKIAAANYFPKITASGTYMYANKDLQLISDEATTELTSAGTILQKDLSDKLGAILSDPVIRRRSSPCSSLYIWEARSRQPTGWPAMPSSSPKSSMVRSIPRSS